MGIAIELYTRQNWAKVRSSSLRSNIRGSAGSHKVRTAIYIDYKCIWHGSK